MRYVLVVLYANFIAILAISAAAPRIGFIPTFFLSVFAALWTGKRWVESLVIDAKKNGLL